MTSIMTLTNNSSQQIAYKLKSTQPKIYLVKPSTGIIDSGARVVINLTLHHNAFKEGLENFKDKFLLIEVPIQKNEKPIENLDTLFNEKNKDLRKTKIPIDIINHQGQSLLKKQNLPDDGQGQPDMFKSYMQASKLTGEPMLQGSGIKQSQVLERPSYKEKLIMTIDQSKVDEKYTDYQQLYEILKDRLKTKMIQIK